LDGDNDLDLAVANGFSDNVSILMNLTGPYSFIRGDATGDGQVNFSDVAYLLSYLFKGGPAPAPLESGDANCDNTTNLTDAIYLLNYLFKGGLLPGC
jgi:hypothetical protein